MGNSIDEAFNWLVLILTSISAILIEIPETSEIKQIVALEVFPPILVLVLAWLTSALTEDSELKVITKSYAWMYASFLLFSFSFVYVHATALISFEHFFGFNAPLKWVTLPIIVGFFSLPFLFHNYAIKPKYQKKYVDSNFLNNIFHQIVLYILVLLTFYPFLPYIMSSFISVTLFPPII